MKPNPGGVMGTEEIVGRDKLVKRMYDRFNIIKRWWQMRRGEEVPA